MSAHQFRVVCGVDLSEHTPVVLTHMLDQAVRHEGAALHVVTVVPERSGIWHHPTTAELDAMVADARSRLEAAVGEAFEDVGARARAPMLHVRVGVPEEEIIGLAAEAGADLIVVGRFGAQSSLRRRWIGSVADRVLAQAECPVLIVQGSSYAPGPDSREQCPDCVEVRAASHGEAWFCAR